MKQRHSTRHYLSALLGTSVYLLSGAVWAATIFVNAANDTGIEDGTLTSPYDTVGEALAVVAAGDTVSVAPGIYYGAMSLPNVPVSVVSQEGPEVTILDGMNTVHSIVWAHNLPYVVDVTFDGFTMTNAYYGVFVWSYSSPPVVTLRNSILRNLGTGVRASIRSTVTLENTTIVDTTNDALQVIWGRSAIFHNVTIDNATRAVWSYQYPSAQMFNTTISNVGTAFSLNYYVQLNGSHNNVWNYEVLENPNDNTIPGTLNITDTLSVDPLFIAPPDDYRLDRESPLIDAGIDVGLPYEGMAPDIGAYEFNDLTLLERVDQLATSFAEAPPEIYREPGEQRVHALYLKLMAVVNMVSSLDKGASPDDKVQSLNGALNKLQNDILQKTDGNNGGNPANDWIDDPVEKSQFYNRVVDLLDFVQAEINAVNNSN